MTNIEDPRGFHLTVPDGFEAFPGFKPTANKLYAFGKNLGTPEAVTLTIDVLDGPATAGAVSKSCGALMNSIDRTIGKPITEKWGTVELNGLRMVMTHVFGEVVVFCVDVPVTPNAISVMVSGKPANEAVLQETFRSVVQSTVAGGEGGFACSPGIVALVAIAFFAAAWVARRASRK